MHARSTFVAALFLCGGPWLSAQQTGPGQAPTFRTGIELVTIDVNVVDKQGQPLRGLGPDDFVVTVGGLPRRVVTAEFVDVAATQSVAARPDLVPISTNEGAGLGRQFVFIVDQSTLEPGNARHVARAAARFLAQLTFADRSALMLMPVGPNVAFTWAHDRVRDALQRVSGQSSPINSWEFGSLAEARDIANHNMLTLRSVGDRECRGSIFAGGGGSGPIGTGSSGPTGPGAGPAPPPGGGAPPGGGETGGGSAPPPPAGGGGGTPTGGGSSSPRGGGGSGAFGGLDGCMRDVQMQAESTWRGAQMTSLSSLTALRQVLGTLAQVRGDKTVILISGGWPLDEREETSLLSTVAGEAAAARVTLFTLFVPGSMFSADRRVMSATPSRDHYLYSGPLDTLAGMTGGGSFRAEVNAEAIFERLGRELAGYYRIGVERNPSDQDGKGRRMKVQVSRSAATVRAREIFDVRTYEDRDWAARLASALDGPIPASGVGLRVTSYLAADPENHSRVKIVLTGEASRIQPGEATFQVVVRDLEGKRILSGEQPLSDATVDGLQFSTNIPVSPGSYIVRIGVMDSAGRVGSVEHRVDAQHVTIGALAGTGPLLVRVPSRPEGEPRLALDGVRQDERLALEVGLQGDSSHLAGAGVQFEVAATAEGPALVQAVAVLSPDPTDGLVFAHGVADMRLLPPGDYVARAKIKSGSEPLGEMRRAFTVLGATRVLPEATSASTAVVARAAQVPYAARAVGAVPAFALDQVLGRQVLGAFLDRVAARSDAASPMIRELVERARTEEIGQLFVSDTLAAQAPVASFLRGLALLAQKKFDLAANAFRSALRASPDFYPAMVYLGACYAAGGKDKDAAGAWSTALIKEGDAATLHVLLADAQLRYGSADLALQTVDRARARWPADVGLKRRFVVAALLAGKYGEGLQALDELIEKRVEEEPSLALGLLVLHEAFANDRPVEGVEQDRARMMRLADVYRARGGPSLALVETWVAVAKLKR